MDNVETPVVDNLAPATSWKDGIDKGLRFNEGGVDALSKYPNDIAEAAPLIGKSYLELQKTMGDRVKIPGDDADDDEKGAFYQRLGRPEKVDGYTMPALPEGEVYDQEVLKPILETAHAEGVSDKAFGKLAESWLAMERTIKAKAAEAEEARVDAETKSVEEGLQTEWAGDYDKNIETIERVFREFTTEETRDVIKEKFNAAGLGRDPVVLEWLKDIGKGMLNDTIVRGTPPKGPDKDYTPKYINSPEMYRTAEGEDGEKARQWFTVNQGFVW